MWAKPQASMKQRCDQMHQDFVVIDSSPLKQYIAI